MMSKTPYPLPMFFDGQCSLRTHEAAAVKRFIHQEHLGELDLGN